MDKGDGMGSRTVSVVIPTFNRSGTLLRVLRAMEAQTVGTQVFDLVVVDDGSRDDTPSALRRFAAQSPLEMRCIRQENRGPAAARNRGIAACGGSLLVLLGDDTIPTSQFLEKHLAYHRKHEWNEKLAVVGYTDWPPEMTVTPFLRYIGESGPQFAFRLMPAEVPLPFRFFYSSNVSFPRRPFGCDGASLLRRFYRRSLGGHGTRIPPRSERDAVALPSAGGGAPRSPHEHLGLLATFPPLRPGLPALDPEAPGAGHGFSRAVGRAAALRPPHDRQAVYAPGRFRQPPLADAHAEPSLPGHPCGPLCRRAALGPSLREPAGSSVRTDNVAVLAPSRLYACHETALPKRNHSTSPATARRYHPNGTSVCRVR